MERTCSQREQILTFSEGTWLKSKQEVSLVKMVKKSTKWLKNVDIVLSESLLFIMYILLIG